MTGATKTVQGTEGSAEGLLRGVTGSPFKEAEQAARAGSRMGTRGRKAKEAEVWTEQEEAGRLGQRPPHSCNEGGFTLLTGGHREA